MTEQHALGFEASQLELAYVVEDISVTLNMPSPVQGEDRPPFSDVEHRAEWNAWWSARRKRFLHEDARYRLLERRHGTEVMEDVLDRLDNLWADPVLSDPDATPDAMYRARMQQTFSGDLPIAEPNYDIEDLLLLNEIAADAERVAEHREIDERLERDFETDAKPEVLKTYRDLASAIMHLFSYYEGEGHSPDCGLEISKGADPSSNAEMEKWHEHLWTHVFNDERFLKLARYWGVETVQEAMHRHNEFETNWLHKVMLPNMEAAQTAREHGDQQSPTERQMQRTAREHSTLRRMLAIDAGLTEDLPER